MPVDRHISREHILCLKLADCLWSWFVVGPLCVFYWSGTWKMIDTYIIPDNALFSGYVSLGIGMTVGFIGYIFLPLIKECVDVSQFSAKHVILSRLFIYIHSFGTLNFWRGVWQIMDGLVDYKSWHTSAICAGVSLFLLILLRSMTNCIAVPFVINLDTRMDFYHTYPRFRTHPQEPAKYIGDIFMSHFVITHLVIQVWRGMWHLMDIFIWPNHRFASYMLSLGIGYGAAVVLAVLQYPFYHIAKWLHQRHKILELIFEDIVKLLVILTTLLMWHGGWGLCKDYVLNSTFHFWASHAFGTAALLIFQVMSTVGVPGVAIDCHTGQGSGMVFPIDYFLHFYRKYIEHRSIQVSDVDREAASPIERENLMAADSLSVSSDEEEQEHSKMHPRIN